VIEEILAFGSGELVLERPHDVEALLDAERFAREDEFLPYWAELWPSGLALARALDRRPLRGRRVLELGCGLGVPSLVAARAGADALATDWAPEALELLERNAARNGIALRTARVDWREPEALLREASFDLVLGADLLYEERNVEPLLDLLPRLIRPPHPAGTGGGEAWIADPGRAAAEAFFARAPSSTTRFVPVSVP
jgi:predicted nicotinamide N-methyase